MCMYVRTLPLPQRFFFRLSSNHFLTEILSTAQLAEKEELKV